MDHYIIVGRKIDQGGTQYLHADGEIDGSPTKDGAEGTALNVEYIGKRIVELSQQEPLDPTSEAYRKEVEVIRKALVVVEPDNFTSPVADLKALLDNVTVQLEYDTRVEGTGSAPDKNIRKLVIPSRGSFEYRKNYFENKDPNPGFRPPLTYTLDQQMMKLYFGKLIDKALLDFKDANGAPLEEDTRKGLSEDIHQKLGNDTALSAEDPTEKAKANILTNPLSAFYRAVGIYTTNMCD